MNQNVRTLDLFLGFAKIGMLGFGGIGPISRHVIVEERKWLTEEEYAAVLGMGQVLPGPNTVNAGVIIGDSFRGMRGSLACVAGIMLAPCFIVVLLAILYGKYSDLPDVNIALIGAGAAAAGMIIGTALKMIRSLKLHSSGYLIILFAVLGINIVHWPMGQVLLVLIPVGLILTKLLSKHG